MSQPRVDFDASMLRSPMELRSLDEEGRTAVFTASTEHAVPTRDGPEVLRMAGARLQRFRKNPVVLDSHNRFELDAVIGRADVTVKGRELVAEVTYAPTERGERAWQLVRGGFVRAMSIGYSINPRRVKRLREGEADGEGEARVEGPAVIVREWELLEVSNVPVPADQDAVRRALYDAIPQEEEERHTMDHPINRAMGDREIAPAAPPPATASGAAPTPAVKVTEEISEERAARVLKARREAVLAITPRGLEHVAEACVLEGLDIEGSRKRLLEEQAKRLKPIGTPEPVAPAPEPTAPLWPAELDDEALLRSLKRAL